MREAFLSTSKWAVKSKVQEDLKRANVGKCSAKTIWLLLEIDTTWQNERHSSILEVFYDFKRKTEGTYSNNILYTHDT